MHAVSQAIRVNPYAIRNFVFFVAVIAMNYTLSRPSPVDFLFIAALGLMLFLNQTVRIAFVVMALLVLGWVISFLYASLPFFDDPNVKAEAFKKSFVVTLAVTGALVSTHWRQLQYDRLFKVYALSAVIAAMLGIAGFFLKIDILLWDDRAKGLIDDPNMYGSFLLPGVLFCIYLLHYRKGSTFLLVPALLILFLGVLLSFSRAAIVALILTAGAYSVFVNRHHLTRLVAYVSIAAVGGVMVFSSVFLLVPEFSKKFLQRATFAESYDQGHSGRYGRYVQSIPLILENPRGIGILQQEKIFVEPIHNIFLSSFLNYGWGGGLSWVALFLLSLIVGTLHYRSTQNPVAVVLLFAFLAPVMCASLHEGEHWRHLWLMTGLLWGFNPALFGFKPAAVRAASQPVPA